MFFSTSVFAIFGKFYKFTPRFSTFLAKPRTHTKLKWNHLNKIVTKLPKKARKTAASLLLIVRIQ